MTACIHVYTYAQWRCTVDSRFVFRFFSCLSYFFKQSYTHGELLFFVCFVSYCSFFSSFFSSSIKPSRRLVFCCCLKWTLTRNKMKPRTCQLNDYNDTGFVRPKYRHQSLICVKSITDKSKSKLQQCYLKQVNSVKTRKQQHKAAQ